MAQQILPDSETQDIYRSLGAARPRSPRSNRQLTRCSSRVMLAQEWVPMATAQTGRFQSAGCWVKIPPWQRDRYLSRADFQPQLAAGRRKRSQGAVPYSPRFCNLAKCQLRFFEGSMDWVKNDGDGTEGAGWNLTLAPLIARSPLFYSRPQLRLFVNYAS